MYRDNQHVASPVAQRNHSSTPQSHYLHHDFDGSAEICTTLVHAIADVAGVDVTDAESALRDCFDVDALNNLFRPKADRTARRDGRVQFIVLQCEVTIFSDGRITIVPLQQRPHAHR